MYMHNACQACLEINLTVTISGNKHDLLFSLAFLFLILGAINMSNRIVMGSGHTEDGITLISC